jgi:chromosome segregation ATPase
MIDNQLLESAKYIRKEFLILKSELDSYQDEVKGLGEFLLKKVEELTKYKDEVIQKIKTKDEIKVVTEHVLKNIQEIEDHEKTINRKVDIINKKIDKLKSDELTLYKTIKDRYPKMSDEEIKNEIQSVI